MTDIEESDRTTAAARVLIPDTLPALRGPAEGIEDYEDLHHTYIGGAGNRHLVVEYEEIEEPEEPGIAWGRLFIYALVFGGAGAVITIVSLVWSLITSIHVHPGASAHHSSGAVFAWLVVGALILAALRGIVHWWGS